MDRQSGDDDWDMQYEGWGDNDGGEPDEELELRINDRYHFRGQSERLIYLGNNFSGNGYWHQFALIEKPSVVWCELLDSDLEMLEETNEQNT